MVLLVGEPFKEIYPWKSEDGKFAGYLIPPLTLTPADGSAPIPYPAGAILAVPKYEPHEEPSINKYSPTIAQAASIEGLRPQIEAWLKKNQTKTLWSLRTR